MVKKQQNPRKRGNGEGSYYYDASKKLHVYAYYSNSGERRYLRAKKVPLLKAKVADMEAERSKGRVDPNVTLSDWADRWLETYKKGNVLDTTYATSYESQVNNHIKPHFGKDAVIAIKSIHIQEYLNTLAGYSLSMIDKITHALNGIFETAIDNDIILKNPMRNLSIPEGAEPKEKRAYSADQKELIIRYAKKQKTGAQIILFLETGARLEESLAWRWCDVDLLHCVIYVNHAVKSNGKGACYLGPPKNKSSKRAIPFGRLVKNTLIRLHHVPRPLKPVPSKKVYYSKTELPRRDERFLFPNQKGGFKNPNNYRNREYKRFFEELNASLQENKLGELPLLTPHELRHTFGTLLRRRGVDPLTIARVMGHSTSRTTEKTYLHDDTEYLRSIVVKDIVAPPRGAVRGAVRSIFEPYQDRKAK